jgi:hypothetical protein
MTDRVHYHPGLSFSVGTYVVTLLRIHGSDGLLKRIAAPCVTRHRAHHYLGFAQTQRTPFEKANPPRWNPLL